MTSEITDSRLHLSQEGCLEPNQGKVYIYNVGGTAFTFSEETVRSIGSISTNILASMYSGEHGEGDRFVEINPVIFQKWFEPYIRHGILPDESSIIDGQERQFILVAAEALGFTEIQEHLIGSQCPETAFSPAEWIKYYGEEKLKELGIDLSDSPSVPRELLEELDKPSPYFDGKKVSETAKLFFIPKGLTLNNMGELAKSPIEGNKVEKGYWYMCSLIEQKHGDIPVQKSYWVLMTTDVIPDSRGKRRDEQLALASRVEGYDAPNLLEAVVCNYVNYVESGMRLFGVEPWTYTCCNEEPINVLKLIVGAFASDGLVVNSNRDIAYIGIAGVRRK
ncbi:MAG: hypothetical protein H7A37_03470 [Chlamydiales bacterium]|nr:hypothetical protein [Chlamydiia bacterium]MCP5507346.1 hypothetical protein [Chlamydiales bacterium]